MLRLALSLTGFSLLVELTQACLSEMAWLAALVAGLFVGWEPLLPVLAARSVSR